MANLDPRQEEMDLVEGEDTDMKETPSERFKRIANHRLSVSIQRMRLLRRMFEGANARNYEWTPEQAAKLVAALEAEVRQIDRLAHKRDEDEPIPLI